MNEPGDVQWRSDAWPAARAVLQAVPGDPAALPDRLCRTLAAELRVDGAAMSTNTQTPLRYRLGSSDELAETLETVQFTAGEGPCVEAAATGKPIIVEDLHAQASTRWPGFADLAARYLGEIGAVFGYALTIDGATFGSVNLYSRARRGFSPAEIIEASHAVTTAAAALLACPPSSDDPITDDASATADPWRTMHLAVGIVAGRLDTAPAEALARMRAYALSSGGAGAAQRVQGERSVDDGVCGVGETFMVAAGVPTQDRERPTHVEGALLGEHSLGLLDDHPAVQGLLQLPSDLFKTPQFALTQDRDRGHLR